MTISRLKSLQQRGATNGAGSRYAFAIRNGRCIVTADGLPFFMFNQLDFKGLYAYKDDTSLYGIDLYRGRKC